MYDLEFKRKLEAVKGDDWGDCSYPHVVRDGKLVKEETQHESANTNSPVQDERQQSNPARS